MQTPSYLCGSLIFFFFILSRGVEVTGEETLDATCAAESLFVLQNDKSLLLHYSAMLNPYTQFKGKSARHTFQLFNSIFQIPCHWRKLSFNFIQLPCRGYTTVGNIVWECCEVLWRKLMPLHMRVPKVPGN